MAPAADSVAEWVRLDEIEPRHCGIVREFVPGEGDVDALKAMGVCLGRKVMLVRAGDPLILKVLGTRLGLSARLAARVLVEPCGGNAFGRMAAEGDGHSS
ncbi:MAG: ferrous iron transport protein A [Acidobacteriota bacterium]|nr:ferrous iron transport protein A [Acidobacteriota bacterium]MDH3525324.1 ferrous iron transport protein A [Acidobacteriota bacterium]